MMTKLGRFKTGAGILLTAAAVVVFCASSPAGSASPVRLTLAPEAVDFDGGLDVRDSAGRPVFSPAARAQLRQLFVGGMFALLMRPELPRVAELLTVLQKAWNALAGGVSRAAAAAWGLWLEVWSPPFRKDLAPPWFLLLATLAALPGLARFLSTSSRTESHLKTIASTVIRC